ncbi:hypothetical protein [Polystyrenella longa]|uniref:hypothetical protein n=1 Tax=Polystyrenella longa TaxID=2528007 RepID=UPI0011A518E0|nr:hypothetical protein [Polystyrenella longa]
MLTSKFAFATLFDWTTEFSNVKIMNPVFQPGSVSVQEVGLIERPFWQKLPDSDVYCNWPYSLQQVHEAESVLTRCRTLLSET